MRRREFVTGLGGAVAAPLIARAQGADRMRRIGVISSGGVDDPDGRAREQVFQQALQAFGRTPGRNIQFDFRRHGAQLTDTRKSAAEPVALAPDLIVVIGTATMAPVLQGARTRRSCSSMWPIRSAPGLSRAWRSDARRARRVFLAAI